MAFECQDSGDSLSPKKGASNSWDNTVLLANTKPDVPHAITKPNYTKKPHNKSIVVEPVAALPARKGVVTSGSYSGSESDLNDTNAERSITDLPVALVSEILHCLDAKDLGIISCVSTLLHSIASDHQGWKDFYCQRWGPPAGLVPTLGIASAGQKSWKELFVEREYRTKSFMGRYSIDILHGHTEAVRAVFLLAPAKLIFTGGYDSVIRMWDMEEGLSIAVSRSLGCTIRAITADTELLVASGTDAFLQCWRAIDGHPHLFDIAGTSANQNSDFRLWGHDGPVTCLALDSTRIYSGSWDMSIRIWDRAGLKCLRTLRHRDWVWDLAPRGGTVVSTAGRDAYVWDTKSGELTTIICSAHSGNVHALTRSHLGDLLFTGGEDGCIHMFEVGAGCNDDVKKVATWIPHTGPIHSLAFEYPWVVSSASDGRLALINVRKLLKSSLPSSSRPQSRVKQSFTGAVEPPQRMLHGLGCNQFSVSIGADRIVCGGEIGIVRVWNFSQALEIEKRVQALRSARQENRMRRRKVQNEMNANGGRTDQCSVTAKRNQMNGDRNGIWHSKRGIGGKLKA